MTALTTWFPPVPDRRLLTPSALAARPHARLARLEAIAPLLASPDSGEPVTYNPQTRAFSDGVREYPSRGSLPVLLPSRLLPYFDGQLQVPAASATDALLKYFSLASFRHSGDINAPSDDVHFQRHLHRMHEFVRPCHGLIVDVGCDDAAIGASLFAEGSVYLGVDPFSHHPAPFRLIGVAEFLPIRSASVDVVVFNTTLDHIFDWHRGVEEAHRVLKPGGQLVIATLVWTERADLLGDAVHFHHFRDYEIFGGLSGFEIEAVARYAYKSDSHRHGLYVRAMKGRG